MITKITSFDNWLKGTNPLPAGAVPLAADNGEIICLMPTGRWIGWLAGCISSKPPSIQKDVVKVLIDELGGTAKAMADKTGESPRTVEGWAQGRPISIKAAYNITTLLP